MPDSPALSPLRAELLAAADGLVYVTESEAPFEFVAFPGAGAGALEPAALAALLGRAGEPAERRPLASLFAGHLEERDPADAAADALAPRYAALRDLLLARLGGARLVRVGAPPEIRCFLVGTTAGAVAGLATVAYES